MEQNLFEIAAREHYRFPYKGSITVEDLYDLNVQALDLIYKALNSQLRKTQEDSLLAARSDENVEIQNKIDIVKYVVNYKFNVAEQAERAAVTRQKKQRIMELISEKKDDELRSKSTEELEKMLADLT